MAKKSGSVPKRSEVKTEDTWDLSPLFKSDAAWEKAYRKLEKMIPTFETFRGTLGTSAKNLRAALVFDRDFDELAERVGAYAQLKSTEDVANSTCQGMVSRFIFLATRAQEAASFMAPEIQAVSKKKMDGFLKSKELAEWRYAIEKLLRFKPYILSEKEERLLAMQGETAETPERVFEQLNDADMTFGTIEDDKGKTIELTQSSYRSLMEAETRAVRKQAFHQFYDVYEGHANTLAAALSGSVLQDVYNARVRGYDSARGASLFRDNVPETVYDSLIEAVHGNLDTVYKYLAVRRKALKLKKLHFYDTYVPLVRPRRKKTSYDQAVEAIAGALAPLGRDYVKTLYKGMRGRWVDRYENKGKRSGAFCYGTFSAPPYMMMNYRSDTPDSMFTLAHEAGHAMHSFYSAKHQPYQYYQYTIFVAEVASTFNEQLLNAHLIDQAKDKAMRAYLVNREIDEIRGTIIRQTMFAEFEKIIHALAEAGEPLTVEVLRAEYRKLLELYFGPGMVVDDQLDLEGMRIPHFYSAFYVYKYATGLSAAIALAKRVLEGGKAERDAYLGFLQAGCSKYSLEILRDAGVDMEQPEPVDRAMRRLAELVDELETLL